MHKRIILTAAAIASLLGAHQGLAADLIVSMNDNHTVLDADANQVAANPMRADTADIIDVGQSPPRVVQTFDVPGSVVGPPFAVWVAPDVSWAIFTSATKPDPAGKFGIAPDDRVSVVDLSSTPPHIVQTLTAGAGATTVRLSPDGTLALVANRTEGSVSAFAVKDKRLTPAGKTELGKQSGASGIAFSKDGKTILVQNARDRTISVFNFDGHALTVMPDLVPTGGPVAFGVPWP